MAGKRAEQKADQPKQLGFHLLAGLSTIDGSAREPEKQDSISPVAFDATLVTPDTPQTLSDAPQAPLDVSIDKNRIYTVLLQKSAGRPKNQPNCLRTIHKLHLMIFLPSSPLQMKRTSPVPSQSVK